MAAEVVLGVGSAKAMHCETTTEVQRAGEVTWLKNEQDKRWFRRGRSAMEGLTFGAQSKVRAMDHHDRIVRGASANHSGLV